MSIYAGPEIADAGLVVCLDAANTNSYASTGTASISFAANSRIRLPTTSALQFGSGDFTIEFWMQAGPTQTAFATITDASTNNQAICIGVGTNNGGIAGRLSFFVFGGTGTINSTTAVLDNTWRHIACVKSGATGRLFVNGVLEATTADWATVSNAFISNGCLGGSAFSAGTANDNWFAGSIANFAVYNTAVYTTNFTVPTQPPAVVSGLQLLYNATSAGAYLVDSSVNNFVSTVGFGTPAWNGATPFTRSDWLDVSGQRNNAALANLPNYTLANSGSVIFNGTNQQVVIPTTQTFSTAVTVETWFSSVKATRHHLWNFEIGSGGNNLSCDLNDSGFTLWIYWNSGGSPFLRFTTPSLSDGVIRQLVFVHDNNVNTVYLNGAVLAGGSTGGAQTFTTVGGSNIFVGSAGNSFYTQGNIYNFKVYNSALSAEQVNQNFQALRGRFGI